MNSNNLIPDWGIPKSIGLVWPDGLPDNRNSLCVFYSDLIKLLINWIPENVKITIIHRPGFKEKIFKEFGKENVNLIINKNIQDIWIRDFAPFWNKVNETLIAVKGMYYPYYGGAVYLRSSFHDENAGVNLAGANYEPLICNNEQIILDGGNLTHNGEGIGICTNRLVSSNEFFFIDQLIDSMKKSLGLNQLILLPSEFGDDTGHIDGMVRFVSKETVLVSDYSYKWRKAKGFIPEQDYYFEQKQFNEISEYLLTLGFKVHRIPNGIPLDREFESAVGNYMNFLRVGKTIFVPQYSIKEENLTALKSFLEAGFSEENIIPVPGCNQIADLGGVLNCITTHLY